MKIKILKETVCVEMDAHLCMLWMEIRCRGRSRENYDNIESINVLKDKYPTEKPATDKIGEKGKDGVVEINKKKECF